MPFGPGLAILLASPLAGAATYDPQLHWRTLQSEHFEINFHDGEAALAEEMADAAEHAWSVLTPEIENAPKSRVELVLVDWTDSSNGFASIVPTNTIVIFVTAPEEDSTLALYEDWNSAIVTHELTHILHIDTVEGLPKLARLLMGTMISTHQASPGWIVEGYATFEETRMTHAGRGRNAEVDMVKRTAALEDRFPPLGNLDGYQSLPPGGNLRYLFGQDFMQFIADRTGPQKWTEWVHRYGASVPFLLPAKSVFGETFVQLYREWKDASLARYRAQAAAVEAEGVSAIRVISQPGESCGAPAFSPDGKHLAWSCSDPHKGQRIWLADDKGEHGKITVKERFARNIAWRGDSGAFAYSALHTVDLWNTYEDVGLYDLKAKSGRALTNGQRARDPEFSPDGSRLLVVTNGLQNNQLALLTIDQRLRTLTSNKDHTQYGAPRYSPDGRFLALSVWKDGTRDLWLYTADGRPWRRLTWDTAIDREPAWSADGKWLYFTSDRSGIPNIYAIELATERLYRVTNVLTGAWGASPHPDGTRLACLLYANAGAQVGVMDLDPAKFRDLGLLPRWPALPDETGEHPLTSVDVADAPPSDPEIPRGAGAKAAVKDDDYVFRYPVEPYKPLRTLFPPRYWLPGGYLTTTGDSLGLLGAASTYGSDSLHYFAYAGMLTYRTDARFVGGSAAFSVNRWRPVFTLGVSTQVTPYGDVYVRTPTPSDGGATIPGVESALTRYWDRRVRGSATVAYPIDEHTDVSASYTGTLRTPLDPVPDDTYIPFLPTRGFFSSVSAGWRRSSGKAYALSISPEDGRSLAFAAEYTSRWLGSYTYDDHDAVIPFDQLQATGEWREYIANPLVPNHVIGFKLSGGGTLGDKFKYGSFRLGGTYSEGGLTVVPSEWRSLRGFLPASDSGEWYWLSSLEYRFPLVNVDRGVGTIPVFLRSVSGAIVADAGNAFDDGSGAGLDQTLVGVGAELRVASIWLWGLGVNARFGYAFAAHGGGIPIGDPRGLYASLGSSF